MFEFARCYGHFPDADFPWVLFLAGIQRTPRFAARTVLELVRGISQGVGGMFGGGLQSELNADRLLRTAYPMTRSEPRMALIQSGADGG